MGDGVQLALEGRILYQRARSDDLARVEAGQFLPLAQHGIEIVQEPCLAHARLTL